MLRTRSLVSEAKDLSRQERLHWLEIVENNLKKNPHVISLLYDRAALLRSMGAFAEAEIAYQEFLAIDPGNFSGLIELSNIYVYQQRYVEALEVRNELLHRYPNDATAISYFADMILLSGDVDTAHTFYARALALAPHHTLVHRGLAEVMRRRGCLAEAEQHTIAASEAQAYFPRQFRGAGDPIPMLLFVSETEQCESSFADRITDEATFLVTKCIVERIEPEMSLPAHAIVLNGISDADRSPGALVQLECLLSQTDAPIINPPKLVAATSRTHMVERLKHIPGVRLPQVVAMTAEQAREEDACATLVAQGLRFPLLIRIPEYHAGRYFEKVESAALWAHILAGFPELPLLAMEYIDVRDDDGYFHKMRIMCIDGEIYPTHLAFGTVWKLHYFSSNMMYDAALREREASFLIDPRGTLGEAAWRALEAIAREVGLDYFGIDCAIGRNGEDVVFECNAAMVVAKPGSEAQWAYRIPSYEAMMQASHRMLERRAQRNANLTLARR